MKGNILNFTADTAIPPHRFVTKGSADGHLKLAAEGDATIGVSMDNSVPANARVDAQIDGVGLVIAGGPVQFNDCLKSGADGKAIASTGGNYDAVALESGVEGDIVRIKVSRSYSAPVASPESEQTTTHTVTLPTGNGFTADFAGESTGAVKNGSSVGFIVLPDEGYQINSVTDGTNTLLADEGVYTINNVTQDITVVVTVSEN